MKGQTSYGRIKVLGDSMTEHLKKFDRVYIETSAQNSAVARRAYKIFPKNKIQIVSENFFKKGVIEAHQFKKSKKSLLLKEFKGSFFKRCPGAKPKLMCCNYFVLNLGQNCEMDCSYCYLQSFINLPAVVIYTNIEKAFQELEELKKSNEQTYIRIGTGEQTDSLSLDDISLYSTQLIDFFNNCPHWLLEFKTKSNNIKNFENTKHSGNVVVSWSVNPEYIVQKEEHQTSSLKERLSSARKIKDKGFKVSFHIDPIIYHLEWKKHYSELVNQITKLFSPQEITHISLGALRFQTEQKSIMRKRFGMKSLVCQGEFFKAKDGKLRYDQELRQEMFKYILNLFKKDSNDWPCFLCMETPENWLNVMKAPAKKIPEIKKDFDLNLINKISTTSPFLSSSKKL